MVAQRNVAHYLNDAKYRALFNEARDQLRTALEKECATSLAECAKPAGKDDPYRDPAMNAFYAFTMTYDLPQQKGKISADGAGRGRGSAGDRAAASVRRPAPGADGENRASGGLSAVGRDRRPAVLAAGESAGGISDGAESTLIHPVRFVG
jgi:hypothetical protein